MPATARRTPAGAALAIALVVLVGCSSSGHHHTPLAIRAVPATYRIVYRVESGKEVSTRIVEARRPFDLRTENRAGPPPGGDLRSISVATFNKLETKSADSEPILIAIAPGVAPGDLRPEGGLAAAIASGQLEFRQRRTVLGRRCEVYRDTSHVDRCIDGAGLLLEQRSAGQHLLAVTVDANPTLGDDRFAVEGTPLTIQQGGGSVRPVDPSSLPPGSWWVLPNPPAGFTARGRFAVVPPNQSEGFSDPSKRDALIAGFADVYVRGRDVLVVDQGSTLGGVPPFKTDDAGTPADVGPAGKGELVATIGGAQLRINLGHGHYLRLIGSLPPDELRVAATQLVKQDGSALRYLD